MPIDFTLRESQKKQRLEARGFAAQVSHGAAAVYDKEATQSGRFRSTRPFYRIAVAGGLVKGQIFNEFASPGHTERTANMRAIVRSRSVARMSLCWTPRLHSKRWTGLGLTPLIPGGNAKLQYEHMKVFLEAGEQGEPLASSFNSEPGGTANWLEKDAKGLQTTATQQGDEWVINGEKLWTTNSGGWDGKGADLQCIVCRPARCDAVEDPAKSIIILLATRATVADNEPEAYTILDEPELMGHPSTSGPHSRFTNFRVPAANGRPSMLTWKALHALEHGPGESKARQELCLVAKIFGSDNCVEAVTDAIKVVGMTACRRDLPLSRLLNDAIDVGIRRRQMEKILQLDDYDSIWAF